MKIPTEVRLCWDFFLGGALVSSAPTEQKCTNRAEMHHLLCWCSRDCCTPWKAPRKNCTNRANHKRLCWGCVGMAGVPYPPITARLNALRASFRPNPSQPRAARAEDRRSASLR